MCWNFSSLCCLRREMGARFGDSLFPRPLAVRVMTILRKYMRWGFLHSIFICSIWFSNVWSINFTLMRNCSCKLYQLCMFQHLHLTLMKMVFAEDGHPFASFVKLHYRSIFMDLWNQCFSNVRDWYFSDCFCQHFANGDAWSLPSGAYETMSHLKDAGGYVHHELSLFVGTSDCKWLEGWSVKASCFCLIELSSTVKLAVVSNFDTRLRKLLKDLNIAHL